jgi:hypothetical protein
LWCAVAATPADSFFCQVDSSSKRRSGSIIIGFANLSTLSLAPSSAIWAGFFLQCLFCSTREMADLLKDRSIDAEASSSAAAAVGMKCAEVAIAPVRDLANMIPNRWIVSVPTEREQWRWHRRLRPSTTALHHHGDEALYGARGTAAP